MKDLVIAKQKEIIKLYEFSVDYNSPYLKDLKEQLQSLEQEMKQQQ